MTMHTTSLVSLVSLALLAACGVESHPAAPKLQANRFASSEWSEPVNLGPVVNSTLIDARPALSFDGTTLYFQSTRPGAVGCSSTTGPCVFDLWVTTRSRLKGPN